MPLTLNVHIGLAAWAAGSFGAGQRCASGGQAYQCTSGGSSSAAPTGNGSVINNGGTAVFTWLSAVDVSTMGAINGAIPATLTQPVVVQFWNDATITTTSGVPLLTLSGHATTVTNNITLRPAPGEGFADALNRATDPFQAAFSPVFGGGTSSGSGGPPLAFNAANGVSFVLPASGTGNTNYVTITDNNVIIQGLQFQDPNPTSASTILKPTQNLLVQGCIFDGASQAAGAYIINPGLGGASGSVFRFVNNLVIDRAAASAATSTISGNYSAVYANNTFVAINSPASLACITDNTTASGIVINQTNNLMLGYFNPAFVTSSQNSSTVINVQYGLFSAPSLTSVRVFQGPGNIFSQAASGQFVSATTNFYLLPTSSGASSGLTDTADIPSALDIVGVARPAGIWSRGAAQFVVPTAIFSGGGHASGQAVGVASTAVFSGGGRASGQATPYTGNVSSFAGGGHASGTAVSTGNISSFSGGGRAGGIAFSSLGAIGATVTLQNPGTQVVGVAFEVSGVLTITPELQFADDASLTFTAIPQSGISPLGQGPFTFVHPAIPATGAQVLLVEETNTDASAAVHYFVVGTPGEVGPSSGPIGASLTSLQAIIPAYIYQEYNDDQNIQAFAYAYNLIAQAYLDWINNINLPIYTGSQIVGSLLDWVAAGLYGIVRPVLASTVNGDFTGPFNTYQLSQIAINETFGSSTSTIFPVTDDIFKRIITWAFYKGDGTTFNAWWLKRRVARFLAGANGTDYSGPLTQISVKYPGNAVITITITEGGIPLTLAPTLQAAILTGVLPLPFQYTYSVLINAAPVPPPPILTTPQLIFNAVGNSQYLPLG